jgi:hypothetical protein
MDVLAQVDHLVYATPDLNGSIETLEKLLGIRATFGGQHAGKGTCNALIALGSSTYLEILGPDPAQPEPNAPRWFGIDTVTTPRLVTWAAKGNDLARLVSNAADKGVKLGEVKSGTRRRFDRLLLTWQFTDPDPLIAGGVVPFLIDWGQSPHPAASAAQGAALVDLRAQHPDSNRVQALLGEILIALPVCKGPDAALVATILGPRGLVELR